MGFKCLYLVLSAGFAWILFFDIFKQFILLKKQAGQAVLLASCGEAHIHWKQ